MHVFVVCYFVFVRNVSVVCLFLFIFHLFCSSLNTTSLEKCPFASDIYRNEVSFQVLPSSAFQIYINNELKKRNTMKVGNR